MRHPPLRRRTRTALAAPPRIAAPRSSAALKAIHENLPDGYEERMHPASNAAKVDNKLCPFLFQTDPGPPNPVLRRKLKGNAREPHRYRPRLAGRAHRWSRCRSQ